MVTSGSQATALLWAGYRRRVADPYTQRGWSDGVVVR